MGNLKFLFYFFPPVVTTSFHSFQEFILMWEQDQDKSSHLKNMNHQIFAIDNLKCNKLLQKKKNPACMNITHYFYILFDLEL